MQESQRHHPKRIPRKAGGLHSREVLTITETDDRIYLSFNYTDLLNIFKINSLESNSWQMSINVDIVCLSLSSNLLMCVAPYLDLIVSIDLVTFYLFLYIFQRSLWNGQLNIKWCSSIISARAHNYFHFLDIIISYTIASIWWMRFFMDHFAQCGILIMQHKYDRALLDAYLLLVDLL